MTNALKKSFTMIDYSKVEYEVQTGGHYDKNFNYHSSESSYVSLEVMPNEIYKVKLSRNYNLPTFFFLNNDTLLFAEEFKGETYSMEEFEIQIPYGCNRLVIQSLNAQGYKYVLKADKISIGDIEDKQLKPNTITYRSLEKGVQDLFIASYRDIENLEWVEGCYINNNGEIISVSGFSYCKYPVYEGQQLKLKSARQWNASGWVIQDKFGVTLSNDSYSTEGVTKFEDEITIPKNGAYLCLNMSTDISTVLQIKDKYELPKVTKADLSEEFEGMFDAMYQQVTNINWVNDYYMTSVGDLVQSEGQGYAELNVKEGDMFRITGSRGWQAICYLVKDIHGAVLLHDGRPTNVETKIVDEIFTIPKGGVKLCISKYGFKELFAKNKTYVKSVINSNLYGKKILFNGDSICAGVVNGGGYAKIIKDMTGCLIENRAVGGGTLTTGGTQHKIVDDIANMSDVADLICFEGGINDYWGSKRLGTITPMNDWTGELDTTTIVGALESIFRQSLIKWQGVPICMVFTQPIQKTKWQTMYEGGHTMYEQTEALKEVCRKYSIPYVDLLNESGGFNCNLDFIASKYTTDSDGCHPNELGYKKFFVPQILKMFESLMITN